MRRFGDVTINMSPMISGAVLMVIRLSFPPVDDYIFSLALNYIISLLVPSTSASVWRGRGDLLPGLADTT
ncbi:hypothetical protein BDV39DRAFT_181886 [Aspergillus sergii]|uniref:Uncharacterized protein n=1 Tax=Aspergillus sergii TaxID=1034303 RepID=A0A5N6WSC3_9EURO|nr:hypothetical protein BDV39DRAFT_181886 [Aspergillus sergii]